MESGSAYVFFGGVSGGILNASAADLILNGQVDRDNFGYFVSSAGDFNGDGYDDLFIASRAAASHQRVILMAMAKVTL